MNISAITTTAVEQSQKTNQRSSLDAKPEQQPVATKQEQVNSVSALSKSIDSTFQDLAAKPDVDMDKVAMMKAAIASGEFKINIDETVNAMVELHKK
ncbi:MULTISPECIES: flagellar biosynthesis anti-sigma factor FlgM [unclassified Pseudoalteromonas]|uniref:Negative regulator of flagellin synthesis n=1 Tax=Pseudoalteromonas tetraodonis TaxID=43659 RepID=A0ABD4EPN8_9GAMM|nr:MULTISPECIES: flagellar biosynthesis anti-sigma factor FlgM [Pseudoalteromonas]KYL36339.1 flagellar biosynthesis anti-sigma factor FlgM [Pseudoalteromonas spiralis]